VVSSRSRNFFYSLLVISLAIAGLLLLFNGWWLPEPPAHLELTGSAWLLLCVATYFVRTRPYLQLAAAWLWFACSTWSWWKTTDEHSVVWFLYHNLLSILILVFSHLVVVNIAKNARSRI
jgi:hypothetical protein